MSGLHVAVYEGVAGSALSDAARLLGTAGYRVTCTTDPVQFRDTISSANCAVVFAFELSGDLLPRRLDGAYVPPIVLISPLPLNKATRPLKDSRVVHLAMEPKPPARMLVGAVTGAVVTDLLRRLHRAGDRYPHLPPPVRAAIRQIATEDQRRVKSVARSLKVSTRTLEEHWLQAFGLDSPKLKDFSRGACFLRVLRIAAGKSRPGWSEIGAKQGIAPSTLRRLSLAFTGRPPSELDTSGEPQGLIARVCARAIPPQLLDWMFAGN